MKRVVILLLVCLNILSAQNVPFYIPTNGLVAWYPFTGNANDSSGNGNNSTFIGTGVVPGTDRFNQTNHAYDFAGNVNDYIRVPADNFPTGDRTVSLWFNVPTVSNRPMLLGYGGGGFLGYGTSFLMGLNVMGGGSYHCQAHYLDNAIDHVYTNDPINAWNHYVVTVSGNQIRIYVNGVQTQSNTAFTYTTIVSGRDLVFGVMPGATGFAPYTDVNGGYLQGKLDDIAVWNRALTPSEILSVYNTCSPLITGQPSNQTKNIGTNAQFMVVPTNTNCTFQWQIGNGSGFSSITNTGQFSGVTTATLQISNVTLSNYGQQYRCVVNNGTCADTSSFATLYVLNPSVINELEAIKFNVFPNPFNDHVIIEKGNSKISEINVYDLIGKEIPVAINNSNDKEIKLSFSNLESGVYLIRMKENDRSFVLKIIKN